MTGRVMVVVAAALAFGIPSGSVAAQDEVKFGLRAGFGISETTIIVGVQAFKDIESIEKLGIEGIGQIGFGSLTDNVGFKTIEVGVRGRLSIQDDGEKEIFGFAGPVIYRWSVDDFPESVVNFSVSTTDVAFTFGGGVELENGLGAEAALNASAITSLQVMGFFVF